MKYKTCSKCKINKPFNAYFRDNRRKIGIRCKCKICCKVETMEWRKRNKSKYNNYAAAWRAINPERQHATDIKRHYGLRIEEYNALLSEQENKCKICGKKHNSSLKRGRLYVDHDHLSGKVRGLLCGSCNSALGHFNDDIVLLEQAIKYIKFNSNAFAIIEE